MTYYSERVMHDLRITFESRVLGWRNVTQKKMFGCPCYQVDGRLFAFLVTNGVVLTQLSADDQGKLGHRFEVSGFRAGKKLGRAWARVTIKDPRSLTRIMPWIKKGYALARSVEPAHSQDKVQ